MADIDPIDKIDVEKELNEITEIKNPPAADPTIKEPSPSPSPSKDEPFKQDFKEGEIPKDDTISPHGDDDVIEGEELEDLADIVVEGIDMLGQMGAKFAYEKTAFTPLQRQHLNELLDETEYRKKFNLSRPAATPYEKYIARRGIEMDDYLRRDVPMTPKERTRFSRRLKKVIAQSNFKVSPAGALIATVLMYLISRLIPIITNFLEGTKAPPVEFSQRSSDQSTAA